jgi:hypothetical protein
VDLFFSCLIFCSFEDMASEEATKFSFMMTVPDLSNDIDILVKIFEDGEEAEVKKTAPK